MTRHLKIVRILARTVIVNVIVIRYCSLVIIYFVTYCLDIHIILELEGIKAFLLRNISFVFCWR